LIVRGQSYVMSWLAPRGHDEAYALAYAEGIEVGREGRYAEALAVFDRLIDADHTKFDAALRGGAPVEFGSR